MRICIRSNDLLLLLNIFNVGYYDYTKLINSFVCKETYIKMKTVDNIMVKNVLSVKDTDSVHHARMLLKDKGVRHLPVEDSKSGDYIGMLSQRSLLNYAFKTVEKYGLSYLEKRERQTPVSEVMLSDGRIATPDMSLLKAGEHFMSKKISCLPVVDNKKLVGIVTSVDFVKLSLHFLANKEA